MANEQFKIDDGASLFNLKATFNAFLERLATDGAMNRAPNASFEMVHKDSLGIDRLHGWTFADVSAATNAPATPGNYTKTQSKITWNLDDGDVATMDMSGRLQSNNANEFGFLLKFKTNTPVVVSIESSVGMFLNNEIGNGIGYFRDGEDPETIASLSNPTATFPNLFTWNESDGTTISTEKRLFFPQSLTNYIVCLIPIKFAVSDIENETITLNIKGLANGTLFDMEKIIVKEGFFEREFMGVKDHFNEHVRYNQSSGKWEISQDGDNWSYIVTSGDPVNSHTHTKAQVTDLDVDYDISAYLDEAIANGTQTGMTVSHNGEVPKIDFTLDIDHDLYLDKATYDADDNGIVDLAESLSDGGSNVVTAVQARGHIDTVAYHRIINDAGTSATELWSANKINTSLAAKENSFSKNTGFNLNLGTIAGTISEGNHSHAGLGSGAAITSIETITPTNGTLYTRNHTGPVIVFYTLDGIYSNNPPSYEFFFNGASIFGNTGPNTTENWIAPSYLHAVAVSGDFTCKISHTNLTSAVRRIVVIKLANVAGIII